MMYPQSSFKEGDLVMFKNRTQPCECGLRVEKVDTNMFDTRLKVDGLWWIPESFIPFEVWREEHRS